MDTSITINKQSNSFYVLFFIFLFQFVLNNNVNGEESYFTNPTVLSIERLTPTDSVTSDDEVTFRVTFSDDVSQVSSDDFLLSGTAAADGTIASLTKISDSVFDIKVTGLTNAEGTIGLDIKGVDGSGSNDIANIPSQLDANSTADAQITSSPVFGQSFKPITSGLLLDIILKNDFGHSYNGAGTLELILGEGYGGTVLATESIQITSSLGEKKYSFSNPANVTSGTTYTIRVNIPGAPANSTAFSGQVGAGYPHGILYQASAFAHADLFFKLFVSTGTINSLSNSIPSIDETYAITNPPIASNVAISGDFEVGEELTGGYDYFDSKSNPESGTSYKWYRSDNSEGANKTVIPGATDTLYTVVSADETKYVSFEVTPSNGTDTGSPVESSYFGPIDPLLRVESITHLLPSSGIASASDSVIFRLEFNGPATNVTTDDFIADSTAGGTVSSVNKVDNNTYDVRINNLNALGGISKLSIKGTGGASGTNDIAKLRYSNGSATISQTEVDDYLNQNKLGQSFKATSNNYFTAFTLFPKSGDHSFSGTADLKIYSGNEDDGGATLLTSQTINITSSTAESGQSFTVENPPELTSGQTYSFIMDNWSGSGSRAFSSSTNGNYGNGRAIFTSNNSGHTNFDLKFEIFEGTQIAGSVLSDVGPETNEMFTIEPTPPENLTITGNEGWRMMSSPVTSTSFGTLLDTLWTQGFPGADVSHGSSNVYAWNESTKAFQSISNATDVPATGSGFVTYVYSDDNDDGTPEGFPKTLSNSESQFTGTVNPTITFTDSGIPGSDGWNLLGNPYGTTIDWDSENGWNRTNLDQTFYVWSDSAGGGSGAYLSWNGTTGTLENGKIAPWQGFWVKANAVSPSISINDSVRSTGGVFFKQAPSPQIKLRLSDGEMYSNSVIMFNEKARKGYDLLDAYKLASLNGDFLLLGSSLGSQPSMDIQALPNDGGEFELDLNISGSDLSGGLTLSWEKGAIPEEWKMVLIDRELGTEKILNRNSSISFELEQPENPQKLQSDNLPKSPIQMAEKAKSGQSRFMLRVTTGTSVINELISSLPSNVELQQNYPNPFNPSTTIGYGVPENGEVTLEVFDMVGRKVATLLNGEQKSAGRYTVNFDASNLASGMYIYRLQAGSSVITKKLTLIK